MNDLSSIKSPATALLVAGILNAAFSAFVLIGGIARVFLLQEQLPADDAERYGFIAGTVLGYGIALLSLILSPVIIYGAVKMMKAQSFKIARVAAVLAVIPLTSCCFVVSIPVGIWALIVLGRSETRAIFDGSAKMKPPEPPSF